MKQFAILALVTLTLSACGVVSPVAPTVAAPVTHTLAYDINVPDVALSLQLRGEFPDGVRMAPVAAQAHWDYTRTYGGSPNVYYGAVGPQCPTYVRTGIVIAPLSAASKPTFTSADWPGGGLEAGVTYEWVGRFAFSEVAPVGSYSPCLR